MFIFTFIRERLSGFLLWIDGLVKRFVSLPGELERDGLRLFEIFTGELFHRDFVYTVGQLRNIVVWINSWRIILKFIVSIFFVDILKKIVK